MMIPITILHDGTPHRIEVDSDESIDLLRHQIFSISGLKPEEQRLSGLGICCCKCNELRLLPIIAKIKRATRSISHNAQAQQA